MAASASSVAVEAVIEMPGDVEHDAIGVTRDDGDARALGHLDHQGGQPAAGVKAVEHLALSGLVG